MKSKKKHSKAGFQFLDNLIPIEKLLKKHRHRYKRDIIHIRLGYYIMRCACGKVHPDYMLKAREDK